MRTLFVKTLALFLFGVPGFASAAEGEIRQSRPDEALILRDAASMRRTVAPGAWEIERQMMDDRLRLIHTETRETIEIEFPAAYPMPVPQPDPHQSLWNFFYRGSEIGQDVDVLSRTRDVVTMSARQDETRSCTFYAPGCPRWGCPGIQIWRTQVEIYDRLLRVDFLAPAASRGAVASFEGNLVRGATRTQQVPVTGCFQR